MHISEGVLSAPVLLAGAAVAAGGVAYGLKRMDGEGTVSAALVTSAFFVASLIHLNIGPASVHLVLNGLVGLVLGWSAFPAIFTGLLLQALLFQYGGLTTLGVNTVVMAAPAVAVYLILGPLVSRSGRVGLAASFGCGFLAVLFSSLLLAASLVFTGENFTVIAWASVVGNAPVMVVEGLFTAFVVSFLLRVYPELLGGLMSPSDGRKEGR
ncbi:cobalt transporter CbiM [Desulfoluna butyratoxydans]|uniref:Cobalamin (Vitamin b12) biosynthesis cbim family n=1 Tax=Desulfoluna butyratoxydans TaxID=231438 RepID=A0A4U8YPU7_9BACT|nr:cobalt transporter CbiM [Desulfoluna butyratoxydans]VFQ45820.1 cobalamin (vitamin b12) biosynthesis cbim family [Desulfoluna butyratoxydans]